MNDLASPDVVLLGKRSICREENRFLGGLNRSRLAFAAAVTAESESTSFPVLAATHTRTPQTQSTPFRYKDTFVSGG